MASVTTEIYFSDMPPDMLPQIFKRDDGKRKGLSGGYGKPKAGDSNNKRQYQEAGHEQNDTSQKCIDSGTDGVL